MLEKYVFKSLPEAVNIDLQSRTDEIIFLQAVVTGNVPERIAGLQRIMDCPETNLFLFLCHGDTILGMVQGTLIDNLINSKVFVDSVALHPDLQGLGLGKKMMQEFERRVVERWSTVNKIILTSSERRGTYKFYTSLGYVPRADLRPLVRLAKWFSNWFSPVPNETYFYQKYIK